MDPERWRQVESLYILVREREPTERSAFLAKACQGDESLKREVESMLAAENSSLTLFDRPAYEMLETAERLAPGTQLGPYQIESILGEGGMGVVYRARDPKLTRAVAV
jgi:eukaryotic-like serine/threonine-protein kinase